MTQRFSTFRTCSTAEKCLLFAFSPAFLALVYDLIFYWPWLSIGEYGADVVFFMTILTTFNIIHFFAFLLVFARRRLVLASSGEAAADARYSRLAIIISVIAVAIVYRQLGGQISLDFADVYSEKAVDGAFLVLLHTLIMYVLLYILYIRRVSLLAHSAVVIAMLFSLLMGGRSAVIVWALIYVFLVMRRRRIHVKWIASAMISIVAIFIGTSVLRGTIALDQSSVVLEALDYNQVFTLREALDYSKVEGAQIDKIAGDVADALLPRSLNPDKKPSTAFTREVFPWVWEMTSYTAGLYGNLVFAFGSAGLVMAPVILIVLNSLYWSVLRAKSANPIRFCVLCLSLCPILLIRGGPFESRVVVIVILMSLAVCLAHVLTMPLWNKTGSKVSRRRPSELIR